MKYEICPIQPPSLTMSKEQYQIYLENYDVYLESVALRKVDANRAKSRRSVRQPARQPGATSQVPTGPSPPTPRGVEKKKAANRRKRRAKRDRALQRRHDRLTLQTAVDRLEALRLSAHPQKPKAKKEKVSVLPSSSTISRGSGRFRGRGGGATGAQASRPSPALAPSSPVFGLGLAGPDPDWYFNPVTGRQERRPPPP
jgi:hypothetical protein